MKETTIDQLTQAKVVAILRGDYRQTAIPLVTALYDGGIRVVEVTMNSPDVIGIIERLVAHFDHDLIIGAGTVRNTAHVQKVVAAGGRFVVSPDTYPAVIKSALDAGIVPLPGALTPSEITTATRSGASLIKLFPASQFSPNYIKQVLAPLEEVKLLPTGGITVENARAYLDAGAVGVGVGSALVPKIFDDNPASRAALTQQARQFMEAIGDDHFEG